VVEAGVLTSTVTIAAVDFASAATYKCAFGEDLEEKSILLTVPSTCMYYSLL